MAIPTLTPLPDPPLPTDPEAVFDTKAGNSLTAQKSMVDQMNADVIPAINEASQQVHEDAIYAGEAAARAEAVDTNVSEQVAAATAAANSAQASAAAAQAAAGLPSLTGNEGKFLGVNPAANGVGWYDVGQKVGDTLTTARAPDASYLSMNGAIYLQSAFPALFAILGLIGGDVGVNWSSVASGYTSVLKIVRSPNGTLVGITSLSNTVVRSTDNGLTWSSINAGVVTYATDIDTDGSGKWIIGLSAAVGGSQLRVSTDDGLTWSTGSASISNNPVFCRYLGSNIWLEGGGNSLRRSTDNGVTWAIPSSNPAATTGSTCTTDRNGVCVLYIPTTGVYRSIDGFANLTAAPTGMLGNAMVALTTDGAGIWVGVGATGAIQRSIDNAQTWAAITSGTTMPLSSISTNKKGVWLAGGTGGRIRISKDNLNTWDEVSAAAGTIVTIVQADTFAVAGGNSGAIYRSAPFYSYDTATQFRVPQGSPPQGLSSYIKAKVTP